MPPNTGILWCGGTGIVYELLHVFKDVVFKKANG